MATVVSETQNARKMDYIARASAEADYWVWRGNGFDSKEPVGIPERAFCALARTWMTSWMERTNDLTDAVDFTPYMHIFDRTRAAFLAYAIKREWHVPFEWPREVRDNM
jgi:hypothetical protein